MGERAAANGESLGRVIEVSVRSGELVGGAITAVQDETLTLRISSDVDEQFHIEGYHAFVTLPAGRTATLHLWAGTAGKFLIFLEEGSQRLVGTFEVSPR